MKKTMGFRVKVGTTKLAVQQALAMGINPVRGTVQVAFSGKGAFVVHTENGRGEANVQMNLPALPDNVWMSRGEADLIAAYNIHELGHVLATDSLWRRNNPPPETKRGRLTKELWNGIEDGRIEHAVIVQNPAAKSQFRMLMEYACRDMKSFNPTAIRHAPFALALISRAAYGDGNDFAAKLLDRIPEPKQSLYRSVAQQMSGLPLDKSGTCQVWQLAEDFLAGWLAIEPDALGQKQPQATPAPQQPKQPQEQTQDESGLDDWDGESDDDDDGLFDESDETEMPDDGEEGEDSGEAGPGNWDDEEDESESESDDDGEGDGEGDDESDDDGLFDGDDGEAEGDTDEDGDESDEDGDENGKGESEEDREAEEEARNSTKAFGNDSSSLGEIDEIRAADTSIDQMFKGINKRMKKGEQIHLPGYHPSRRYTTEQANGARYWGTQYTYRETTDQSVSAGALSTKLRSVLSAPERTGWDKNVDCGRFDGKRSARLMAGCENVFQRRWNTEGQDSAVSIVVDLSSSMQGERMEYAARVAKVLAQAIEKAGASVEVVGFSCWNASHETERSFSGRDENGNWMQKTVTTRNAGFCDEAGSLIEFKAFNKKVAQAEKDLDNMPAFCCGGTPDYPTVRTVVEGLALRPEQKRLVLVLTDGMGNASEMRQLTAASEVTGVEVVGIGIRCRVDYAYAQAVEVTEMSALATGTIKELTKLATKWVAGRRTM